MNTLTKIMLAYPTPAALGLDLNAEAWEGLLKRLLAEREEPTDAAQYAAVMAQLTELELSHLLRQPETFSADGLTITQGLALRVTQLRQRAAAFTAQASGRNADRLNNRAGFVAG